MSKLSTPLLVIFAVAAVAGLGGWHSNAKKCSVVTGELITTSNKLAEATAKLAEQGSATETLRTQLTLHKSDLSGANNQIASLNDQLGKNATQMSKLRDEVGNREAQFNAVTRSNAQFIATINGLEVRVAALQNALDSADAQIAVTTEQLEHAINVLNGLASTNASLMAKLNDPSVLRAQLRATTMLPPSLADKDHRQLVLNPDGTVEVLKSPETLENSEQWKFPKSKAKTDKPVFLEVPPAR